MMSSALLVRPRNIATIRPRNKKRRNVISGSKIVCAALGIAQNGRNQQRQHRRDPDGDDEVGAVAQFAYESAPQQRAKLRPLVVPAEWQPLLSRPAPRGNGSDRFLAQGNLFDVLDQAKRFVFVAPEFRRITARGNKLAAAVLLVNDVATQIAQRRLQHIENEFRTRRSTGWTGAQFGAELMLVFRFCEIAKHVRRRAEKDEPSAFVEQDRLVKHLENFRARLVNGDDDDFVVRHARE